jgi:hypothetical protein
MVERCRNMDAVENSMFLHRPIPIRWSILTLHPVDLTPGMLVLVDGAKGEQTHQAGALAVASLTCVIHSRVHTNMYILVGPGAFVQYPRSREKLEVVSDGHGGVKRIEDLIADDDKLQATWLALKDKTPHNVRPKPVGVLNRDRNVGAQKKSVEELKKAVTKEFMDHFVEGKMTTLCDKKAPTTTTKRKSNGDPTSPLVTIHLRRPRTLLANDEYDAIVDALQQKNLIATSATHTRPPHGWRTAQRCRQRLSRPCHRHRAAPCSHSTHAATQLHATNGG